MAQNQKKKILCLARILLDQTDEDHIVSANDLCKALQVYGISAERKSIYTDIQALRDCGMDIVQIKGKTPGYYVGSRVFELAELKLLVDAVQSSKFITTKKSEELIKKLEGLGSKYDAQKLQRQVYIYNRPKTGNETIYYNVDKIHTAIFTNVQIQFQYAEWNVKKQLQLKKNGAYYVVSPWALTWDDENYYLVAYDEKTDMIRHYRVDKIQGMELIRKSRLGKERFQNFDLAEFAKKTFGMYGGHDETVTLLCRNSMVGVILDRFGRDVRIIPAGEDYFRVKVLVSVSQQFFGWLTGVGETLQIVEPESVRNEYKEYLQKIQKNYV